MGFIQRVQERVQHPEDFAMFKDLMQCYQLMVTAGVPRPKVYFHASPQEMASFNWQKSQRRLPNLFVVRPSIFLNNKFDYFLRDDGNRFMNFTTDANHNISEIIEQQTANLTEMLVKNPRTHVLFEEFPIVDNTLQYPAHFRVHTFYDTVGLVQIQTQQAMFWMDTNGQVLESAGGQDVDSLIPDIDALKTITGAASLAGKHIKLPYARIDFVNSTRGPFFRSLACVPGDVRSQQYRWFYGQHDDNMEQLWNNAERRIQEQRNDDSEKARPTPETAPDDNA